jgi:hypothetical protein
MTLLRALLIGLAILVGMQGRRPAAPAPAATPGEASAQVRALLVADIQLQVHESTHWHPVLESSTRFVSRRSHVVPGLVYHWASHPEPVIPTWDRHALVGARGGVHFLAGQKSWAALAAGWAPASRAEALEGCREFVRVSRGEGPDEEPESAGEAGETYRSLLEHQPADFSRRVNEPAVVDGPTAETKAWRVELWTIDPASAALRYRCVFPASGSAAGPVLSVIDSLPVPRPVPFE